jgi:two-component system OmpR family response regulator
MPRHIAIVEDEPLIRANYVEALTRLGFEVRGYASRGEAQTAFAQRMPDLVIIDVGLGDEPEGGFELCRTLRTQAPTLPILFLTARDSDFDVISGLRLGADDYLAKDVSLHQLAARINALLRRMEALRQPVAADSIFAQGRSSSKPSACASPGTASTCRLPSPNSGWCTRSCVSPAT